MRRAFWHWRVNDNGSDILGRLHLLLSGLVAGGGYLDTTRPPVTYFITTHWEHMPSSEATARHLDIGDYCVWVRMFEGNPLFLVLRTGQTPQWRDVGSLSIETAIRLKG
jgi:hypothetical protein